MQKLYSIPENVPDIVVDTINELYEGLKQEDIYSYLYCGYPLINIDKEHSFMKGLAITQKGIFILYQEQKDQTDASRDFIKTIMDSPTLSIEYLSGKISIGGIKIDESIKFIQNIKEKSDIMDKKLVDEINEVIQHIQDITTKDERSISSDSTLGAKIKNRAQQTKNLDETQFETLYKSNNSNLRIRGLAGSGKTILLVKKLAYLHFKDREKRIAYVFYTKSLKQYITTMFKEFYKEFDKTNEPDMNKISIVHAWGNANVPGFYFNICAKNNVEFKTYNDCDFETACSECYQALPAGNINLYDYIFVDEAQDFRINFYKLARKALNPLGKLIYAYDELQTLNDNKSKMPTKKEIFGDDECDDRNLRYCYRSPNEILVTAHALGLGIYHKNSEGKIDFINYVDSLEVLNAVGYTTVDGELNPGCEVTLKRDNLIQEQDYQKIITYKGSQESQYQYVADEIDRLLSQEDITPEDILIIDLDSIKIADNFLTFRKNLWSKVALDGSPLYNTNLVNKDKALSFRLKDSIPYTTIFRAKGNEANIVFILNANKLNVVEMYNRNRIFTAMTRAKFQVYILGNEAYMDELIAETDAVKSNGYTLKFKCLSVKEQKEFKNKLYQDSIKADDMNKVLEILNKYKDDRNILFKLLQEQGFSAELLSLLSQKDGD